MPNCLRDLESADPCCLWQTYCGYYKHNLESGLVGAELMLEAMGYKHTDRSTMVLDTPVDPDRVNMVSKDSLVALVELQVTLLRLTFLLISLVCWLTGCFCSVMAAVDTVVCLTDHKEYLHRSVQSAAVLYMARSIALQRNSCLQSRTSYQRLDIQVSI